MKSTNETVVKESLVLEDERRITMKSKMFVLMIGVALAMAAGQALATPTYYDYFDGTTNVTWTDAVDDAGGTFTVDTGNGIAVVKNTGGGRAPYAYFALTNDDIAAGYTITAKGRCTDKGAGLSWPYISIHFQTADWNHGNWYSSSWGGNLNHHPDDAASGSYTTFASGAQTGYNQMDTWYWLRVVVEAGGLVANFYGSDDGVNYTKWNTGADDNLAVPYHANNVGLVASQDSGGETEYDWIEVDVVPEPGTMVLLGIGGVGLLIRRRR